MDDGLKHIIINGQPYLVEPVVYEWHLALSKENEQLREQRDAAIKDYNDELKKNRK